MDIFFCDSCAARVTSSDLQRGQGLKKGDVIICHTCIEKGLGGDLLAAAGDVNQPVSVTVDSQPEPESYALPPDTDTLVRVGAQMAAKSVAQEHDTPSSGAYSADNAMAEAASGFDALNPGDAVERDDGEDDVEDSSDFYESDDDERIDADESDDDDGEDDDGEDDDDDDEVEYGDAEDDDERDDAALFPDDGEDMPPQGMVDTIEIAVGDLPVSHATADSDAASKPQKKKRRKGKKGKPHKARGGPVHRESSAGGRRPSGRQSSVGSPAAGRGAAPKAGRSAQSGATNGRMSTRRRKLDTTSKALIGAVGGAFLIFVVVLVMWLGKSGGGDGDGGTIRFRPERELAQEVQRVRGIVDAALTRDGSINDLSQLTASDLPALDRAWEELNNSRLHELTEQFEAAATEAGWTEEQMGTAQRRFRELRTRRKTVSDIRYVLRQRSSN